MGRYRGLDLTLVLWLEIVLRLAQCGEQAALATLAREQRVAPRAREEARRVVPVRQVDAGLRTRLPVRRAHTTLAEQSA